MEKFLIFKRKPTADSPPIPTKKFATESTSGSENLSHNKSADQQGGDRHPSNSGKNPSVSDLGKADEGPKQPFIKFPSSKSGKQNRSFSADWYKKHPWLEYSIETDRAYCFSCRNFCTLSGYAEETFISQGVNNWKKALEKFEAHERSDAHRKSFQSHLEYEATKSKGSVVHLQRKGYVEDIRKRRVYLSRIADTLVLTARQCIPQRGHNETEESSNRGNFLEILDLVRKYDSAPSIEMPKNATYISPSSQNEILVAAASVVKDTIIKEMKASQYIAVTADECRDRCKVEQMSFCARYFFDNQIHERFLGLINVHDVTAKGLSESLFKIMAESGIDEQIKIVAQSYDGTNVMSGAEGGLQAKFKEKYEQAIYIHCYAHKLNLILVDVCNKISMVKEFFGSAQALYSYFSRSGLAHCGLQIIAEELSTGSGKLVELSDTRWTCQIRSLRAILKNYSALLKYLENPQDGADPFVAKGLLTYLKEQSTVLILFIFLKIFSLTEQLHKLLQTVNLDLSEAIAAVKAVQSTVRELRDETTFNNIVEEARIFATSIGLTGKFFEHKQRRTTAGQSKLSDFVITSSLGRRDIDADPVLRVRSQVFYAAIDLITAEIDRRFTDGPNASILAAIECMNPSWIANKPDQFLAVDTLKGFCEHYKLEVPEAEISVAKNYLKTCQASWAGKSIADMLTVLPTNMFPTLTKILQIAVTIPIGTATNERSFSVMKRIDTYLRSTRSQERLSANAVLAVERALSKKICLDCVLDKFAQIGNRNVELTHPVLSEEHRH